MLDQAFDALKTFNWGADLNLLAPITDAVVSTHSSASARLELENRLAAVLKTEAPRDAKDFVCRKLMLVGTAASVPVLAGLLTDKDLSHMSRYALERIPAAEAGAALREALPKVNGMLKVGVISSLAARKDAEAVPALAALLAESDAAIVKAAAYALGAIHNDAAAKALAGAKPIASAKSAVSDAHLSCAEALLAEGKKVEALIIYKSLMNAEEPKHMQMAATRGMLACAGK